MGVGLISNLKFQLNFSESQRQPDRKDYIVGAQTTHALMPMQQQNQEQLLNICDEIKVDGVDDYTGNGKAYVSDDVSRRHEAVPDKSSVREYTHFDFIVNMLCNNEVGSGEEDKETKIHEIRGHLPAQEIELKLQTEAVDIRALSACNFHKKVNESDNLSHEQKGSSFHMLPKYRDHFKSKPGLCHLFAYEFEVHCSQSIVGHTQPIPFSVRPAVWGKRQVSVLSAQEMLEVIPCLCVSGSGLCSY